jgi:CRP/FNR family transcriptional regulator, cyclic AMP receptor protein
MAEVVDHLRAVPLFQGLSDRALESVAALAAERSFGDGEAITTEGEAGDAFYVVTAGRVDVSQDGTQRSYLGPGDFLGEISLIDGRPRTATATAVGPVDTVCIRRDAFQELMDTHGAVRLGILMALTERIRRDAATNRD